jgi:protocatechuate 3,4-dioxygenase beta subunit
MKLDRTDYNVNVSKEKPLGEQGENLKASPSLKPTTEIEEGPYYKQGSPPRSRLFEEGVVGTRLTLTGDVRDVNGKLISHAWIDFWQADGRGEYDNSGYTLRGHQYTDESGKYIVETVVPGGYAPRTAHIHVKVRAKNHSPMLTTQLFIPGLTSNKNDFLYRKDLEIDMRDVPNGKTATFNFVLKG